MDQLPSKGLVTSQLKSPVPSRSWPEGAHGQAVALQRQLALGDRDWHALKGQRSRRAAEQLAAALVLLLSGGQPRSQPERPCKVGGH